MTPHLAIARKGVAFQGQVFEQLDDTLSHLQSILINRQEADGHWHFGLDDNITMNAEYILFLKWMNLKDESLISKLANYILDQQSEDGSWSIFYGGPGNLSATIEAYFALRIAHFRADDPRMLRARDFILSQGGVPASRVFTKIWLALFGLYPWKGIPIIPPEILLAPRGLPFNIYEFSYWSRATIIPLTILFHLQKMRRVTFHLDELYCAPADKEKIEFAAPPPVDDSWILKNNKWDFSWVNWEQVFVALNKGVTVYESKVPMKPLRTYCIQRAKQWILDHQDESGDWGGIQPPMINSIMAPSCFGNEGKRGSYSTRSSRSEAIHSRRRRYDSPTCRRFKRFCNPSVLRISHLGYRIKCLGSIRVGS